MVAHPGVFVDSLQFKLCDHLPDAFLHPQAQVGDERQGVVHWDDGYVELLDNLITDR